MDANPQLALFLRSIPLFSLVEAPEMMDILRLLRPVELLEDQVLFREGEAGTAMWVLGKGAEVSVSSTPSGAQRPVVVASPKTGETVGEMALVDEGGRSGTAVVTRAGAAHEIHAVDFQVLRDAYNPAAFKVLRRICLDLCARLRTTNGRIAPSGRHVEAPPLPHGTPASSELIDAFAPFAKLPQVVKLALSQKLTVVETASVQPLFSEGDPGDSAYFVVSGEITVSRSGKPLANLGGGAMFGLVAVIDNGERSASCIANGPATLLRLGKPEFDQLFSAGNRFAFQLVDLVARQLVAHLREANALLPGTSAPPARAEPLPPEMLESELDIDLQLAL